MTEQKRRTRVVSFRLSEEEHRELTTYCAREGVRSLSDFARLATFIQSESRITAAHADTALQQIYRRLAALDREVQRLARLVNGQCADDGANDEIHAQEAKLNAA